MIFGSLSPPQAIFEQGGPTSVSTTIPLVSSLFQPAWPPPPPLLHLPPPPPPERSAAPRRRAAGGGQGGGTAQRPAGAAAGHAVARGGALDCIGR